MDTAAGTDPESIERLAFNDVIRERFETSVPQCMVTTYEANCDNDMTVPFMTTNSTPGDTATNSFGRYGVPKGESILRFKARFHARMADTQVRTGHMPTFGHPE